MGRKSTTFKLNGPKPGLNWLLWIERASKLGQLNLTSSQIEPLVALINGLIFKTCFGPTKGQLTCAGESKKI